MFMLRWQFVPFIIGIAMSVCAIMGLLSPEPPEMAGITSLASMMRPLLWVGLVAGPVTILYAWYKAAQLRHGG